MKSVWIFRFAAALVLLLFLWRLPSEAAVPEPVAGWRMELVAEAPRIRHPSVVACAPDGRVFVAEDPMDISLPNAAAAEGRILCLHTNGNVTVFAEKLYAVFGLQYLEGRLYVLHNPKFSVFDDDQGVGRNRRDLIQQTLPDPSALNWNDHVPANFRLAMDGWFYVACGDKGLYRAEGTDGSRATLSSGGIFRIRPDGSKLEVFCDGVRNILDVAVNSEDEMFTYDNTDEHDWMGRFTHMVEAGFYGYPHDFIPRRAYTLWMMEDFGPGAACGAFAYNEDALPPEYHGNVFLADFGKRQVMRVRVERAGGTWRVASREDMFPNPPGDFRPVGISLGADGKCIYICDWQHRDEKENVSVGRLWKLAWTGKDYSAPKPDWYAAAAAGRDREWDSSELLRGLSHPSFSVRLAAQRRVDSIPLLKILLTNSSTPAVARIHALWALNRLDGGASARDEIQAAAASPDAMLRRQALRQMGLQRTIENIPVIAQRLVDPDASVRFHAATALGRIGNPAAVPPLSSALTETDLFARYAVFTALHRIGTNASEAWSGIAHGLRSENGNVREGTVFALRETYDPRLLETLASIFEDRSAPVVARTNALQLIAALHHRRPEWKGEWGAYHPALQPPPAKSETWAGTERVLQILRSALTNEDSVSRQIAIDGLVAARDIHSAPSLAGIYDQIADTATRATILRALGAMQYKPAARLAAREIQTAHESAIVPAAVEAFADLEGENALPVLRNLLKTHHAGSAALVATLRVLPKIKAASASAEVRTLAKHQSSEVRAAALQTLGRLDGASSIPELEAALGDADLAVRIAATKALGELRSKEAVPALLRAWQDHSLREEAFVALTRTPDERALSPFLDALGSRNPAQRNAAHLAVREISGRVLKQVEAQAEALPAQAIAELRQIYAGNAEAERGPLFARRVEQHSAGEYLNAALEGGDPGRGRAVFRDASGVHCLSCHRVAGEGSDTGPDLSAIGAQFDRRALAESILFPSKAVREGYQQVTIETVEGEEYSGIVKGENAQGVTLRDSSGREHTFTRTEIKSRRNSALSLMPEGLQSGLSLSEFRDLVAYLSTLKGQAAAQNH